MDNVPPRPCQTSWLGVFIFLCAALAAGLRPGGAAEVAASSPPPPPWQAELDAARAMQAALLLAPAGDAAEGRARAAKLAAVYRQLAAKYPASSPLQLAVGDGVAELESPEAGTPYWERAASLDPKNPEAADALGAAFLRGNRVREASAQYRRATELRPDVAGYHASLANVLFLFRHELVAPPALPDEQAVLCLALAHFRRAAELSPGNLTAAKAYAETFYAFPKPDWLGALDAWQRVLALSGENRDFAHGHLARISVRLGRKTEAENYLAAIHDPAYDRLKASLARQLAKSGTVPGPSEP